MEVVQSGPAHSLVPVLNLVLVTVGAVPLSLQLSTVQQILVSLHVVLEICITLTTDFIAIIEFDDGSEDVGDGSLIDTCNTGWLTVQHIILLYLYYRV